MQHQNESSADEVVRLKNAAAIDGLSPSARDREIRDGTYPPPVRLSPDPRRRAVGLLKHEMLARRAAVIRGDSPDQVRELVRRLIAERSGAE